MRISARLDEKHSERLEFLQRETQEGVNEVIEKAIDRYFEEVSLRSAPAPEVFAATGFSGEGPGDLATDYKKYFQDVVRQKHGLGWPPAPDPWPDPPSLPDPRPTPAGPPPEKPSR
jgi:hypothetical protein